MTHSNADLTIFLRELERQFVGGVGPSRPSRPWTGRARSGVSRRGRTAGRRSVLLVALTAGLIALACITAGGPATDAAGPAAQTTQP